jgi:hypothetical protein
VHVTYIYEDPKTGVYRYVGKGNQSRPFVHLRPNRKKRISALLNKRRNEGYSVAPLLINAPSENHLVQSRFSGLPLLGVRILEQARFST